MKSKLMGKVFIDMARSANRLGLSCKVSCLAVVADVQPILLHRLGGRANRSSVACLVQWRPRLRRMEAN